jgi:hypothetical protein
LPVFAIERSVVDCQREAGRDSLIARMRRLLVIILLSLAYVGCAGTGRGDGGPVSTPGEPQPVPPPEERPIGTDPSTIPPFKPIPEDLIPSPEPRFGGELRFLVTDLPFDTSLIRTNVAEGLTPDGLLLSWSRPQKENPCWVMELNPRWVWPDGLPVRAGDVLAAWTTSLLDDSSDLHWLLDPLGGDAESGAEAADVSGSMRAEGRVLEICPERPTPDLLVRLEHLASWLQRVDPATGNLEGPGPYRHMPDGSLSAKKDYPGDGPYLDTVVPLVVEGHSPLLLRLGDAHIAITFGQAADALIEDPVPDLRLERLPAWDRTYFMWMNPDERWVNDPVFRRWLAGTIDRDEMVSYLFDDRGKRAFSLSHDGSTVPVYRPLQADRPLSPMTEPRLRMVYEAADPYSETVAQRVRAVLETQQVELSIVPMEREALRRALRSGDVEIALLAHRPGSEDPVLALEGTVWWLGEGAADARAMLAEASGIDPEQAEARADGAWNAEELLLLDARVIPLIRLHAWLAYRSTLAGLDPRVGGEFRLEETWWLP